MPRSDRGNAGQGAAFSRPLRLLSVLALAAAGFAGGAAAADRDAGRRTAVVCQACHGLDGLSKNPEAPNLAGQVESYLVKALRDYRSEARRNESMNIVAKDLSDADIENVAAYYASIPIEVVPP
ncbi:c-type cytochrome [Microvirga thermotolerans]|uniref:C-type cytochrome n=1 Tax=Microvirga thermotolerans TaxID=2651334 RepID=A0A5P9JXI8_9HYPH|nr:cytochrome c [Microvirga thermotolerans]QFU17327.1 c-type cytochrome [Microvirga thermotolerans]